MELLDNWKEEKRSAYLYRTLAETESNPVHQKLFHDLSLMAEKQAILWEEQFKKSQIPIPEHYYPDRKTKFVAWLVRRFGTKTLRPMLAAMKVRGMSIYHGSHLEHPFPTVSGQMEYRHRSITQGGNLRAAVFGMSDGLLSNASLILGVAGASVSHSFILLSGIAGLLAGAFSMGTGEYISVRSQREMLEHQIELEKHELDTYPEEEAAELALIYQARGLPKEEAEKVAQILIQNPEKALDTLAREELGVNPDQLGSPWQAAFSSFFSFATGAIIPLIPFIWGTAHSQSHLSLIISIILTGISLFGLGAILSLFTHRNMWLSGLRVLLIGSVVGCFTYGIGMLFDITVHS
jgi:VIT1/CCC1 family predicted Fe2+/Mn2+ transporter